MNSFSTLNLQLSLKHIIKNYFGSKNWFLKNVRSDRNALVDLQEGHFLVIEDDPFICFIIEKYIEKWNGKVDIADNTNEAINKLRANKYNAVLLTVHSEKFNGFSFAASIRNLTGNHFKTLPIVALTGSDPDAIKHKLQKSKISDSIEKEFSPEELLKKLQSYIK